MLFLHIGRGKSGSTTIQHRLLTGADMLRAHGIVLPDASKRFAGNYAPLAWTLQAKSFKNSPVLEEFSDTLAKYADQKIIVSSEFLFGLRPHAIAEIRDRARGHTVQVLAYVREYPSWFQSLYGQATGTGKNLGNFDSYFDGRWMHSSVVQYLNDWADVFGWENLRIRFLDSTSLVGGDLLKDLSSVLGVELQADAAKNTSPHWIETEFMRELFNVNPGLRKDKNIRRDLQPIRIRLRESLSSLPKIEPANYLTPAQWDTLADVYAEDAKFIGEKMNIAVPPLRAKRPAERAFLPSLLHAPKTVCAKFLDRAEDWSFWTGRQSALREAVAVVISAWSGKPMQSFRFADHRVNSGQLASL